jgi:phosphoribosylanthranilate isomerase
MRPLVKICGINSPVAFGAAVEAGADYIGFVFYPPSPRYVTLAEAAEMTVGCAANFPLRVGLFVNPSESEIDDVLTEVSLDVLQIHGTAEQVAALRNRFGRAVWHQLGVASEADFPSLHDVADGFLIEAKPPEGATRPGGNGVRANWDLLSRFHHPKPWLLAGGLNPGNVAEALRATGAPGVDVSSGVETAPGVKSPALIKAFVKAARGLT